MFSLPFQRMLWKEYRSQRTLWVCCLVIGILIELLISAALMEPQQRHLTLYGMPMFFALLYAIGSGALMFASEREERTSEWLLSLAAPTWPTLVAKFGWAVVSTVVLQIAMVFVTLILTANMAPSPHSEIQTLLVPFGLAALIWAILGSLLSRGVLASVGGMVLGWMITIWLPLMFFMLLNDFFLVRPGPIFTLTLSIVLSIAVLVGDIWLAQRWCQGHYLDGRVIERISASVQQQWNRLTLRSTPASRVPVRVEYEQPWQRTWQRLVWQERRRQSLHLLLLFVACVFGVIFGMPGSTSDRAASISFFAFAVAVVIPLAMGVLAFESDVDVQQPRFLANRGLAPGSVWMAKQVVWLARALWVSGAAISVSLFFRIGGTSRSDVSYFLGKVTSDPSFVGCLFLSYCCGQLSSIITRRFVLAAVIGVFLNAFAGYWMLVAYSLVLPSWWSLGGPIVAMLAITFWQIRARMLEDYSWRHQCKLYLALVAVPALLVTMLAWHRIAEVTNLPWELDQSLVSEFRGHVSHFPTSPLTADETFVRQRLLSIHLSHKKQSADEIVDLMQRDLSSIVQLTDSSTTSSLSWWSMAIDERADELLQDSQFQPALRCYLARLKLARIASNRGTQVNWSHGSMLQKGPLEGIVEWANHPGQTASTVRAAAQMISDELRQFPAMSQAVISTYAHDPRLPHVPPSIAASSNGVQKLESDPWPFFLPIWERIRTQRLVTRRGELEYGAITRLERQLASSVAFAQQNVSREFSGQEYQLEKLMATTFVGPYDSVHLTTLMFLVLDRQTMIRAAMTRLELIAYRLEHGQLPDRLIQLLPQSDPRNLIDPWSGRLFGFYPSLLLSTGRHGVALLPTNAETFAVEGDKPFYEAHLTTLSYQQLMGELPDVETSLAQLQKADPRLSSVLFSIPSRAAAAVPHE